MEFAIPLNHDRIFFNGVWAATSRVLILFVKYNELRGIYYSRHDIIIIVKYDQKKPHYNFAVG